MFSFFAQDIKKLNTLYQRRQFSFVFLYGRSGTGKTSLIRDFCQDKTALFFTARETAPLRQLQAFRQALRLSMNPSQLPEQFENWEQAFSFFSESAFPHHPVLVLDEFQLLQSDPAFANAFAHAVAHSFPAGKIFLIVTCSSVGQSLQLLEEASGPFAALTAKACLGPVPFYACRPVLADYDPWSQLLLYGITGGLPGLLNRLDTSRTARENIISLFFSQESLETVSPLHFLHRELREIATYNLLLEIMAEGEWKLAEIARKADMGTNKCAKYLSSLMSLGVIRREFPAIGEPMKRVRYVFADHMLLFWYSLVYPHISAILFGQGQKIFDTEVQPALHAFLQPVFETVCAEYLEKLADTGQTPFLYRHTGSWWTGGTRREPFFRIPLIAADQTNAVLGACHCQSEPADTRLLEELRQPKELFDGLTRYYCIFSVSGFTKELTQAAASADDVWLIDLEDITSPQ